MLYWGLAIVVLIASASYALKRRNDRLFREENAQRERLGLPPLERGEFGPTMVEKSAEFRGNINQHM